MRRAAQRRLRRLDGFGGGWSDPEYMEIFVI